MAQRAISEYDAKRILQEHWREYFGDTAVYAGKSVSVTPETNWDRLPEESGWLLTDRLVVKPDQLIGKRGKNGLILLDADFAQVRQWIAARIHLPVTVGRVTGILKQFIIEPYLPPRAEYYLAIKSERTADTIYFSAAGGVDVEENWEQVTSIPVPAGTEIDPADLAGKLPGGLSDRERWFFALFIERLFKLFTDLHFTLLEFNPLTIDEERVIPLDTKARLDDTASFLCGKRWCSVAFPPPFGREPFPEESYIRELDQGTGASLKLTLLNPKARIWTLNAGGGASVVYTDTIVDLGFAQELANYGEYSGNPSTEFTYKYAHTILDLFTREKDPAGRPKILIIGGGIANFTDVGNTLAGIVQALREYGEKLRAVGARIYLRRGGPNWREGLARIRDLGVELGIPIAVHGPEAHMTRIVSLALGEQ